MSKTLARAAFPSRMRGIVVATALICGGVGSANAQTPGIEGQWRAPNGGVVAFDQSCGGELCGRIVRAADDRAKPGTRVTRAIEPTGRNTWRTQFYVVPRDTWVNATLELSGPNTLTMEACMMGGLMCRTRSMERIQ